MNQMTNQDMNERRHKDITTRGLLRLLLLLLMMVGASGAWGLLYGII